MEVLHFYGIRRLINPSTQSDTVSDSTEQGGGNYYFIENIISLDTSIKVTESDFL